MELGVGMEGTDSSIFQEFIVPSINYMTHFGCRLLSLPATRFAVNLCPGVLAQGVTTSFGSVYSLALSDTTVKPFCIKVAIHFPAASVKDDQCSP